MMDKPEDDLPINAVMILEFPPDPQKFQQESAEVEVQPGLTEPIQQPFKKGFKGYFALTTREFLERLYFSLVPSKDYGFFSRHVEGKPDLYGPLWISLTAAVLLAMVSNLLEYLGWTLSLPWEYDFRRIGSTTLLVLTYSWAVPIALWAFLAWYRVEQLEVRLAEVVCLYGYSLTPYLPAIVFCLIRFPFLQCTFLLLANVISSADLISIVVPSISLKKETVIATMISINFIFTMVMYFMFIRV